MLLSMKARANTAKKRTNTRTMVVQITISLVATIDYIDISKVWLTGVRPGTGTGTGSALRRVTESNSAKAFRMDTP